MIKIVRTDTEHKDFIALVDLLEADLRDRYGAIQDLYAPHNKTGSLSTVIIAYKNDIVVGCGCFKPYDKDRAEIKRMFVLDRHRRQGIAKTILQELEQWAKELGFSKAILETGEKQPESMILYSKAGFTRIDNYEPYMNMVESICFGKDL